MLIERFEDIQGVDTFNNEFNRPTFAFTFGTETFPVQISIKNKEKRFEDIHSVSITTFNSINNPIFTYISNFWNPKDISSRKIDSSLARKQVS